VSNSSTVSSDLPTPRDSASRRRRASTWVAVGGLVLVSAAARATAGLGIPTPWISPDELVYSLAGEGLYRTGHLAILGGPTPYYSAVVPLIDGIPLSFGDLALGYTTLKILQALLMSLAAVPVYVWGRTLMAKRWALTAAVLTLAIPGLAYSGLLMSEVAFYPIVVLAAWSAAAAIESPTRGRQALFVLAVALAVATRLQAVFLLAAFPCAIALDSLLGRRRPRILAFAPALAGVALVAGLWAAWRLGTRESVLGAYGSASGTSSAARSLRFVAYHAGDAALLTGVFPFCALLVLLWWALRRGEQDRRARAYLAVAASVVVLLVLEVGVFASREVGLLAERNLIAAAPLLFLGLALWLDRGGPGGYPARAIAGFGVAASILALPLGTLVVPGALPDSFSLVSLYHLRRLTSLRATELALWLTTIAAAALFALLPRRALVLLPAVLLLALAAGSFAAGREVVSQARAQKVRLLGPARRWIDAGADGPVAYVYDGQSYWNAVWENVFWNRRIRWVYDLPGPVVPGPLPQQPLQVLPNGELKPGGAVSPARFAVIPFNYALVGDRVASAPQTGTDRQGLALWKLDRPLRVSTITSGLLPNGDVDYQAALSVYGCRSGTFDLVFLVKEPQTVRVFLDGRLARRATFGSATTWHLQLTVPPVAGTGRICRMRVLAGALLGTTRFAFAR
jgi:hypothetical protein